MSGATKNKLSQEDVQNIIAEVKAGVLKTAVARKYGINHSCIHYHLKKNGLTDLIKRKKSIWASQIDYMKNYRKLKREKIIKYQYEYRHKTGKTLKLKTGKSYKDLLAIENEKRKAKGLYLFKTPTAGFYKKKGDFENPLFTRPRQPACRIAQ